MLDDQQRQFVASRLTSVILKALSSLEESGVVALLSAAEIERIKTQAHQQGYAAGADALSEPRAFNAD